MKKSTKNLMSSPSQDSSSLRSPLVTPYYGGRHDAARQIDVVRLVNNQEQSRQTTVNLNAYRPFNRVKKESRTSGVQPSNLRPEQQEDHEDHALPSEGGSDLQKMARFSRLSEHQTFIGTYQNNHVIGTIMYLLFILFIAIEVLAGAQMVPKPQESLHFHLQKTLIIILSSQVLCYLLMRYLNSKTDTKFIKKSTMLGSIKKMFATHTLLPSNRASKSNLQIVILVVSLILGQVVYCILLSSSSPLLDFERRGFMIASIFWFNFGVPFLFQNFYISQISYRNNIKLKIFPYLILLFMFYSLLESYLFFILAAFKLMYIYTFSKQGYEMFHLDYLVKAIALGALITCTIIKFQVLEIGSLLSIHFLGTVGHILVKIGIVTGAMLTSRVVALHFLKLELYKYLYNQMHVQLAFVIATILLYASYIDFTEFSFNFGFIQVIVAVGLLIGVGVLVYLQGTQKIEVNMDLINEQH